MKAIGIKYIIPMDENDGGTLAAQAVTIKIMNEGGGNYLAIEGMNLNTSEANESPYEFYLDNEKQIDEFGAELKRILKEANQ